MKKVGLIAGNGKFPLFFAQEASKSGIDVIAIGIKGETSTELEVLVKHIYWVKLGQLKKMIQALLTEGVENVVLAGHVKHVNIFKQLSLDKKALSLLKGLKDKKADTLLGGLVMVLEAEGIKVLPSTTFLSHLIPQKGILTTRGPTKGEVKDVSFGTSIARSIAALDIGQTVIVKEGSVVAVEAMEGTDETIRRGGQIGNKGTIVVKVSKPQQDLRFDVPVVGKKTIQTMIEAGASLLAIDEGKSLFFDQAEALAMAQNHNICILAQ